MQINELLIGVCQSLPFVITAYVFSKCFARIKILNASFDNHVHLTHKFLARDVERLEGKSWHTPSREEMQQHLHTLSERIARLEVKLEERES